MAHNLYDWPYARILAFGQRRFSSHLACFVKRHDKREYCSNTDGDLQGPRLNFIVFLAKNFLLGFFTRIYRFALHFAELLMYNSMGFQFSRFHKYQELFKQNFNLWVASEVFVNHQAEPCKFFLGMFVCKKNEDVT